MNQAEPIGNANEGVSLGSQLLPGHLPNARQHFCHLPPADKESLLFFRTGQDRNAHASVMSLARGQVSTTLISN